MAVSPVGDYVTANSDPASRLSKGHGTVVVESAEVAIAAAKRESTRKTGQQRIHAGKTTSKNART